MKKVVVMRVRQSPLNERMWCLDLDCGHEKWMVSKTKPGRKTIMCEQCKAIESKVPA